MAKNDWPGFKVATIEDYEKHRLIGASFGEPGSRKTSFWLEGPGPVAVFSLDQGLEGTVNRELRRSPHKKIVVKEYEWYPQKNVDLQQEAKDIVEQFMEDYEFAISHARTVVLDKENQFWQLFRYAQFGPDATDDMKNYDEVNQKFRRVVNMGKATDINIGFIDDMKDRWGTTKTGRQGPMGRMRAGFKELDGLVHLTLEHSGHGQGDWSIRVGKIRGPGNPILADTELDFGACPTFKDFAMAMFPDSQEEVWD